MSAVFDRSHGESAHIDREADRATSRARLIESHKLYLTRCFDEAVTSGVDAVIPYPAGMSTEQRIADLLLEGYPEQRALLVAACGLAVSGKYEASSKALLDFVASCRKRYVGNVEDFLGDES